MIRSFQWLLLYSGLAGATATLAIDYAGKYEGDSISMQIHKLQGDDYDGSVEFGPQSCAFTAKFRPESSGQPPGYQRPIIGAMRCGQEEIAFVANLYDNDAMLELEVKRKVYRLRRTAANGQRASVREQAQIPFSLREVALNGVNAKVYTGAMQGGASARAALTWVAAQIQSGFGATVVGDAAVVHEADAQGQLLFHTDNTQTPIRGLVMAQRGGTGTEVLLVYQNVANPPEELQRALAAVLEPPPQPQQPPQQVVFRDGSGSLMLPPGWRITDSFEGAANVVGPDGSSLDVGQHAVVMDPRYVPYIPPGALAGYCCDPGAALASLFQYWNEGDARLGNSVRRDFGHVIEAVQVPSPSPNVGGQWALIHFEWQRNGNPQQAVALIGAVPLGGNWGLYSSIASAPRDVFKDSLWTLMQIWQSYYVSEQLVAKRLAGAVESLKEAGKIYAEGQSDAAKGAGVAAEARRQSLIGQAVVEEQGGWRYRIDNSIVDEFVRLHPEFTKLTPREVVEGTASR